MFRYIPVEHVESKSTATNIGDKAFDTEGKLLGSSEEKLSVVEDKLNIMESKLNIYLSRFIEEKKRRFIFW